MSDLFEINGIKDEEVDYYISLGYSKVMAEQIAAFDFPPMPLNLTETAESRDTSGFAPRSSGYVHDYTYFRTDDSDTEYSPAVGVEDDDPETVIASGEYIFWGDKKYNTQQGYLTMCREQNIGYLPFHLTYSEKSPHFCVATEYKREGDKAYLLLGINESDFFRPAKNQNLVLLVDSANLNYKAPFFRSTLATIFASLEGRMSVVAFDKGKPVVFKEITNDNETALGELLDSLSKLENDDPYSIADGLKEAYAVAGDVAKGWLGLLSRVILITGAGKCRLAEKPGIYSEFIKSKLSECIGFSCIAAYPQTNNYTSRNVDRLDPLVKAGEGSMFLANTPKEVENVLGGRFSEILYGRRRFAKARVDFNPNLVSGYRLISAYEHRGLCAETDGMREKSIMPVDDVGNYVMACYELTLTEEGKQDFVPKDGKDYDPDSIVYVRIQLESNESIYREFTRSFTSSNERLDRVLEVEREAEKLKREYEEKLRGCAKGLAGYMDQCEKCEEFF